MDINILESQIHRDKTLQTKENYFSLYEYHAAIYATLSPKEKYQAKSKLADYLHQAFKTGNCTVDELKNYIDILNQLKVDDRWVSQIIARYYELTGGEPKILATKLGNITIESGIMAVSDIKYISDANIDNSINDINQGKAFFWGTGADGNFDTNLRWLDSHEPSTTPKEFRFIIDSSPSVIISVPSGILAISDSGFNTLESPVQIKIEPGNYLVRTHLKSIHDKFFGFVVVVCKTDLPAVNQLKEIPRLG